MKSIAVAGFGAMGQMHAQCLQFVEEVKLAGVVASNSERANTTLARMGVDAPIYPSLDALLAAVPVDAVTLCVPTHLHVDDGLKVVAAGKHLFCEKPLALTVDDASRLAAAARDSGVSLMVGQCIRFWPEYQILAEFVGSGKAGRLLSLSMQRRCSTPIYSSSDWLQDEAKSGGAAFDLHIHDTDFILHLLGAPRAVISTGSHDKLGWSHIFTHYDFPNLAVSAEGGWNYPQGWGFNMGFEAVFENGVLAYDYRANPTLQFHGCDGPMAVDVPRREFKAPGIVTGNIPDLDAYVNELEYFVRCLEAGEAPQLASAEHGVETVRVVCAEIESLNRRSPVVL